MSDAVENLVLRLAEENFDDEDVDLAKDVAPFDPNDVEAWLISADFVKENNAWVKRMAKHAVVVAPIEGHYVVSYYNRGQTGWSFDHNYWSAGGVEIINNLQSVANIPIQEAEEEDFGDDETFEFKDVLGPEDKHELYTLIKQGRIEVSGSVKRHSNHYVHENSTDPELNVEYPISYQPTEQEVEDRNFLQSKMDPEIDKLQEEMKQNIRRWNHKIYREIEASHDDYTSDERITENILANNYTFDEDGNLGDGNFTFNELSPEAKDRTLEKWREHMDQNDWSAIAESPIAEWKWLLKNKGFNDVKVSWSGFSSQGDGASFTADYIDMEKYLTGPDPIEFPEQERDQLWESEEDDEDMDVKDVYEPGRKSITHIATKSDYAEYAERVNEFFARQHINSLSPTSDEDGNWISHGFRKSPCDVCHRPLAGERVEASGFNPETKEVQIYDNVCQDCLYYTEYGQLDDQTMMDLKDNPVTEAEEEDFGDDDFKDVDLDNPAHDMPVGRDKIWSQPATQYYDKFPNNAWEIFVVRPAKPTKKDPRDHRSVFIGILIKTNEGWHQINRNNESWVGPAYQTPSEVAQMMFNSNKDYVWRGLAGN